MKNIEFIKIFIGRFLHKNSSVNLIISTLSFFVFTYCIYLWFFYFNGNKNTEIEPECLDCSIVLFYLSHTSFICTFAIFIFSKSKKILLNTLKFIFFTFVAFIYLYSTRQCSTSVCYLNPFWYLPLIVSFIFSFGKTKYFNICFILLILFPSLLIIVDDITAKKKISVFFETCIFDKSNTKYSPIYLSKEYFHIEKINEKRMLVPNIVESVSTETDYLKGIYLKNDCEFYDIPKDLNKEYITICINKTINNIEINEIINSNRLVNLAIISNNTILRQHNDLSMLLGVKRKTYYCYKNAATTIPKYFYYQKDSALFYNNFIKLKK